ncbi:lipoate--protein ligase [Paenibacillus aceris]|uniref:lipoate--protein ligase n=1 Tax=Paenibacillus aceris TaxID=869555 RepID=A0ABS4HT65_9BACL|nr:lipoate--protein ligase [Paenibacillus aceris]MBP1961817.1 lipoate-protein ligase A [Paenibacillus aceris]NHW34326.1 lipoate--protein ligase [Paenibacillus aceris]
MLFIDNEGITDPRINLAIEEYALRHLPEQESYLLFYINEPSIIIGKNQNTLEEINPEYVKEQNLHVVRRLSGGGAVYHDLGNLNFSFITKDDGNSFHNFQKFTEPVVEALRKLGVEASLTGRNDIQVGDRKISGNAQFATKGRMFSHGTLLFNSEIENVVSALKVSPDKIQSKGIKSIRSRVANIVEFLNEPLTIEDFRLKLLSSIFGMEASDVPAYKLTAEDWRHIRQISDDRYGNWDWNYGKSPKSTVQNFKRFEGVGKLDVRLSIEEGHIQELKIYGDFFGASDVAELEDMLRGSRYEETVVRERLEGVELRRYFGALDLDSFVALLMLT